MKLTTETREVTKSGDFPSKQFGIVACPQAFNILTSKIYTDVELAIVRELSSNAFDAQVEAGNADKPFDVHMPNSMEPWFEIRDYGTGLSPENVEHIFSNFFASTRNESNDFIGAMGIGSKSPFAYTDQYTVISYWNGTKYTYSCYKGEDGAPTVSLMNTEDTTEVNGLSIHVPTRCDDYHKFVDRAQKVYQYYTVRPNITGASVSFIETEAYLKTHEFEMYREKPYNMPSQITVVMGQLSYAVRNDSLNHKLAYSSAIVLHVPMGSCEISASREELQYDADTTLKTVQAALDAAMTKIEEHCKSEIDASACEYDRMVAERQFGNILVGMGGDQRLSMILRSDNNVDDDFKFKHSKVSLTYKGRLKFDTEVWWIYPGNKSKIVFIENDVGTITMKYKKRLRYYLEQNDGDEAYIADINDMAAWTERFGDRLGTVTISTLPEVPRTYKGGATGTVRSFVKVFTGADRVSYAWSTPEDIVTENAVVVPKDGNYIMWKGQKVKPSRISSIAKTLGYTVVYGVSDKRQEKFMEEHGLDNLEDMAKKYAESLAGTFDEYRIARTKHVCFSSWEFHVKTIAGLSDECDDLIKMHEADEISRTEMDMMEIFGVKLPEARDFREIWFDKYEIMRYLDLRSVPKEIITNYITNIEDNANGTV